MFVIPEIAGAPTSTGYGSGLSTIGIGLVLLPTGLASVVGGMAGGRTVDRLGPRALVATGAVLGTAGYASLAAFHSSPVALAAGSATIGLGWGVILTGIASVVIRSAPPESTAVAVAVNAVGRNTSVAIGAQIALRSSRAPRSSRASRPGPATPGSSPWAAPAPRSCWPRRPRCPAGGRSPKLPAPGGVAERLNAAALKAVDPVSRIRGFESHPLR